jgi:hypothetical protein
MRCIRSLALLLVACAGPSPAPLVMTATPQVAQAGQTVVDIGLSITGCASAPSSLSYKLWKKLGNVTVDAPLSDVDYAAMVQAAAVSRSAFDTEAEAVLDTWWTNLPEESGNLGQTLLFNIFADAYASCGC